MKKSLMLVGLGAVLAAASACAQLVPGDQTDPTAGAAKKETAAKHRVPVSRQYPYIATYYVKPTVSPDENVEIKFYVTDFKNSKIRFKNDTKRFLARIKLTADGGKTWRTKTLSGLPSGDHAFSLGKLPEGYYQFGIMCEDDKGLPSHTVWHEFRSRKDGKENVRELSAADLAAAGVKVESGRYRMVPVEIGEPATNKESAAMLTTNCLAACERAAESIKVGDKEYVVFYPVRNGRIVHQAWSRCRVVYGAKYDKAAVEAEAAANGAAMQTLLDGAATTGVTRVVMPKGVTIRVSAAESLRIPSGLTLDLNGATVKMNEFTGARACIVLIKNVSDAHVVNGMIEGDYYEHDYKDSPNHSEWPMGICFIGDCRYCTFENLTVRNITGYGGGNGLSVQPFPKVIRFAGKGKEKSFAPGAIDLKTGVVVSNAPCAFTSDFRDISFYKDIGYLAVSRVLGYQGVTTKSWYYTAAFYDEERKFVSAEVAFQYRAVPVPEKAKFMRVTIEEEGLEAAENKELSVVFWRTPWNCAYKSVRFEHCRCVGLAPAAMRNMLIEDCVFVRCGENLAKCAFDAEDGWDMMQDVYLHRNRFIDNPQNDLLTCAGHNFIIEENEGSIHLYGRTLSPCVRNNKCKSGTFYCESWRRTMHGRYEGNVYQRSLRLGMSRYGDGAWDSDWEIVPSDIVWDGVADEAKGGRFGLTVGRGGMLRNLVVTNADVWGAALIRAEHTTFSNCVFNLQGTPVKMKDVTFIDCQFNNLNSPRGKDKVRVVHTFEGCVFVRSDITRVDGPKFAFRDCEFKDSVMMRKSYWCVPCDVEMTRCKVRTSRNFIEIAAYATGTLAFTNTVFDCGGKCVIDIHDARENKTDPDPLNVSRTGTISFVNCKLAAPDSVLIDSTAGTKNPQKPLRFTDKGTRYAPGSALLKPEILRPNWVVE